MAQQQALRRLRPRGLTEPTLPLAYYSVSAKEAFWSEHWGGHTVAELLAIARTSPLTDLICATLPRGGPVLEAGCGLGQYVLLGRERGWPVVGVDWSHPALVACRRVAAVPLAVMELRALAVRDGVLAAYVSLGVVEHDEAGPDALLSEARRVLGPGGVGKTHLAQAIGYEAIRQNFLVLYRSIFDLVRDFMKDEAFNQQDKTLRKYLKPDLVIIDDMGLKQLPKHSGEYLLEVVMRRYENRSTIMTSNRPLEEWGKLLNDVPTAGAILDRFLHHAQVIAITGKSYRVKEAPALNPENKKGRKSHEPSTATSQAETE